MDCNYFWVCLGPCLASARGVLSWATGKPVIWQQHLGVCVCMWRGAQSNRAALSLLCFFHRGYFFLFHITGIVTRSGCLENLSHLNSAENSQPTRLWGSHPSALAIAVREGRAKEAMKPSSCLINVMPLPPCWALPIHTPGQVMLLPATHFIMLLIFWSCIDFCADHISEVTPWYQQEKKGKWHQSKSHHLQEMWGCSKHYTVSLLFLFSSLQLQTSKLLGSTVAHCPFLQGTSNWDYIRYMTQWQPCLKNRTTSPRRCLFRLLVSENYIPLLFCISADNGTQIKGCPWDECGPTKWRASWWGY